MMKVSLAVGVFISSAVSALQPPRPQSALKATTLDPSTLVNGGAVAPAGWECDAEANCVEVPACNDQVCRTSLDVRIHGQWYDLSGTYHAHAGALILASPKNVPDYYVNAHSLTLLSPEIRLAQGSPCWRTLD